MCSHYAPDDLIIFRFSMPYGPGLPAGRGRAAIINMLHQALHGKKMLVHRDAERSWCFVRDTVDGVLTVIDSGKSGAFNVGRDDAAVSMLEVAEMACALTGSDTKNIVLQDAPKNQTVVKRLSTDRLRALGWAPTVDLEEGMSRTLEWVKTLDAKGAVAA